MMYFVCASAMPSPAPNNPAQKNKPSKSIYVDFLIFVIMYSIVKIYLPTVKHHIKKDRLAPAYAHQAVGHQWVGGDNCALQLYYRPYSRKSLAFLKNLIDFFEFCDKILFFEKSDGK